MRGMTNEELERLFRLERMMTDAYDTALGKIQQLALKDSLGRFREHHQQNAETLQQLARGREDEAPQIDDELKTYVNEVLETLDEAVRQDETLGELRIAEASLGASYAEAMANVDDESRKALADCVRNEKEHVTVLAMAREAYR